MQVQPFITAMGRSFIAFLLIPASWHVLTTSVTFLYDSGAWTPNGDVRIVHQKRFYNKSILTSSMTSLGEATLMAMPMSASLSRTSWKSRFLRDLARERALPWKKERRKTSYVSVTSPVFKNASFVSNLTAPWQVVPKVSVIPCSVPVRT